MTNYTKYRPGDGIRFLTGGKDLTDMVLNPDKYFIAPYTCYDCRRNFVLDPDISVESLKKVYLGDGGVMVICPECDFDI